MTRFTTRRCPLPPSLAATANRKTEGGAAGRVSVYRFRARTRPESQPCRFDVLDSGRRCGRLPEGHRRPAPGRSLVVMQVHYTLLLGDKAVKNSLVLDTVPESAPLLPSTST